MSDLTGFEGLISDEENKTLQEYLEILGDLGNGVQDSGMNYKQVELNDFFSTYITWCMGQVIRLRLELEKVTAWQENHVCHDSINNIYG